MLHKYEIEVSNSNNVKDNSMLNCSMELSLLNNLFRENLITEAEQQEIKRRILKDYKLLWFQFTFYWKNDIKYLSFISRRNGGKMEIQVIEKTNGRINRVTGTTIKERLRVCAYCRVSTDNEEQLNSY